MQELVSTPVQHLVSAHPSDLVTQIQTAAQTRRMWPWATALLVIVVVFYQVEDAPAAKYEHFTGSSGFVSRVRRVWQVEAEGALQTPTSGRPTRVQADSSSAA